MTSAFVTTNRSDDNIDAVGILAAYASWQLADEIARACSDPDRAQKMALLAGEKADAISDALAIDVTVGFAALPAAVLALDEEERAHVLVGLAGVSPFSPYHVPHDDDLWQNALVRVADAVALDRELAERIVAAWRDVDGMHAGLTRLRVAGGAAAAAVMAGVAAFTWGGGPALLGGLGGLSGAAATSHGLALLGGSTALFGMAGGSVVLAVAPGVTAVGATAAASSLLRTLPTVELDREARNAQVSLQAIYRHDPAVAASTAAGLRSFETTLVDRLAYEAERNVAGAPRIKEQRAALATTRLAREWVRDPSAFRERAAYGKAKRETTDWASKTARDVRRVGQDLINRVRDLPEQTT